MDAPRRYLTQDRRPRHQETSSGKYAIPYGSPSFGAAIICRHRLWVQSVYGIVCNTSPDTVYARTSTGIYTTVLRKAGNSCFDIDVAVVSTTLRHNALFKSAEAGLVSAKVQTFCNVEHLLNLCYPMVAKMGSKFHTQFLKIYEYKDGLQRSPIGISLR